MSSPPTTSSTDIQSQQPPPINLTSESSRKDRKSKPKDVDPTYSSSSSSTSTRQRTSSNGSTTSTGSHRHHHHHHHSKTKVIKDKSEDADATEATAAAAAAAPSSTTEDAGSTASSTRRHRHRHRSRDPEASDGDDAQAPNNNNNNNEDNSDGDNDGNEKKDVGPDTEAEFKPEKSKVKDSTRKRSSSNRVLPPSAVTPPLSDGLGSTQQSQSQLQTQSQTITLKQPVSAMSSLATTSYSVSLGPTTAGPAAGIIKSGVLAMKMDKSSDDDDNNSNDSNNNNDNNNIGGGAATPSARSLMWHEGHFTLYQDGTFDEHVDGTTESTIFSGTVRSLRRMDDVSGAGSGASKEVILNETRYTHFVKVLLAVPSGQGMIRQVAVDLGMKTDAELSAWVATFEACDTYILKPIKPVGASGSTLSTLSTAKSKREAKSEWAIKKSESAQLNFLITKRGWVKYRGVMKQWSLRLFVLKPPMLIYYKDEIDESKEAAVGIINLHNCNVVKRESKKDGFCFKIYGSNDKHSIYASRGLKGEMLTSKIGINPAVAILRVVTQEEGLEWIRAIEEAIAYANFCQDGTFTKLISSSSLTCSGGDRASIGNDLQLSSSPTTVPRMPQQSQSSSSLSQNVINTNTNNINTNNNNNGVNVPLTQSPTSVSPNSVSVDKEEKSKKKKHKKQTAETSAATTTAEKTTATVTITEKDVEGMTSFQGLKFLEPRPTNYAVEIPREEMKIDAFEQGKNIILQLMKQVKPGMDLTKVTLPTHILEPRSFLEKMTDYFTHIELLSQ